MCIRTKSLNTKLWRLLPALQPLDVRIYFTWTFNMLFLLPTFYPKAVLLALMTQPSYLAMLGSTRAMKSTSTAGLDSFANS